MAYFLYRMISYKVRSEENNEIEDNGHHFFLMIRFLAFIGGSWYLKVRGLDNLSDIKVTALVYINATGILHLIELIEESNKNDFQNDHHIFFTHTLWVICF